ncbi:glycoside hydrolase family 3 N-terminal domain-containing protein [Ancylobacter sp. IITR112]|uniref:glycoside hydrolase family 3 N-terminal domain-containing protein n=1 Tax=Ancylobacter sp. IITR112 TaxID=3138073 RepID=UPI003529DE44
MKWRSAVLVVLLASCLLPAANGGARAQPAPARTPEQLRYDIEEKVSRTLLVGFNGDAPDTPDTLRFITMLGRYPLGGIVVFDRNVRDAARLSGLIGQIERALPERQLAAVDEEGGAVRRLRRLREVPATPAAATVSAGSLENAFNTYATLAGSLARLGFDVNFGPVVDLDLERANPVVGGPRRSYGNDPATVAAYAGAFVRAHDVYGVATVLKHFPGHGSTRVDPHQTAVDASRSWSPREMEPFRMVIAADRPAMVMTSHIVVRSPALGQASPLPATFSGGTVATLRRQLGFKGLVVSDDITMGAMGGYPLDEVVHRALLAGHDLVILANLGTDPPARIREVITRVADRAMADPALRAAIEIASGAVDQFKRERAARLLAAGQADVSATRQREGAPPLESRQRPALLPAQPPLRALPRGGRADVLNAQRRQ